MAKQTYVRMIDDIDGSEADRTIRFGWDGAAYEIALKASNARAFAQAVDPYLKAATRTSSNRTRARKPAASHTAVDPSVVRAWAIANGHTVSARGRVSGSILDAYRAAQRSVTDAVDSIPAAKKTAPRKAAAKAPARKTPAKKAARRKAPANATARRSR